MLNFVEVFMNKIILFFGLILIGCAKHAPIHPPVGGILSESDLAVSKNRSKNLNLIERSQIEEWIKTQPEPYYSMSLNYWTNKELLDQPRRLNGEVVSYEYDIYDFNWVKLYDNPVEKNEVTLGKIAELKPIEDAVRQMEKGQEVILLIPSALGFGTYGDEDRIPNDMPLIIKLKLK